MYNVKLDENGFFTGGYAIIGRVENGIDVETLPPEVDGERANFYKYVGGGWIFDEVACQTYLSNKPEPEPTNEEKIKNLTAENELLKGCIMEIASIVYA